MISAKKINDALKQCNHKLLSHHMARNCKNSTLKMPSKNNAIIFKNYLNNLTYINYSNLIYKKFKFLQARET